MSSHDADFAMEMAEVAARYSLPNVATAIEAACDEVDRLRAALTEAETRQILRKQQGECERLGRHFYRRDMWLGFVPVGEPYCMWCGAAAVSGSKPA